MNITELDELEHPALDDWLWRESLYFSFHDASGKIGGMTTIGVRPNQNRFEALAVVFLNANQEVLFYHTEGPLGAAHLCSVPGITYEMLVPLQQWHVEVTGDFCSIDPQQMVRGVPLPQTTIPAGFRFTFDAMNPPYEFPTQPIGELGMAARHYEQSGRFLGEVSVGRQTFTVDGFAFRDHSWGVRDLSKIGNLVALLAQFGPHLTVNAVRGVREGQEVVMGYVSCDGVNVSINSIQVAIETDLDGLPETAEAEIVTTDDQRFSLQVAINSTMPILVKQEGILLRWHECSAWFRYGQQVGYGILETTNLARGSLDS